MIPIDGPLSDTSHPRHGGDLALAISRYGGNKSHWLDLSTGISPWTYPIPEIDNAIWRELPNNTQRLNKLATNYYGCAHSALHPTPGSQLAIRMIPNLINCAETVGIPLIGYQEHAYSWKLAGHTVIRYSDFNELSELAKLGKVHNAVVINPNNPSCQRISKEKLVTLSEYLNGILLIDEAFADLDNHDSLSNINSLSKIDNKDNIIILRSLGKFFGLAGARIGFIIGHHNIVTTLNALLSPWSISAPAIHIAEQALADTAWQQRQRQKITEQSDKLNTLLERYLHNPLTYKTPKLILQTQGLFSTLSGSAKDAHTLHQRLAEHRIWTRLGNRYQSPSGDELNWLRLSLPGDRFIQLAQALADINWPN